ncbi:MAG: glycosyltransferase family 39 protein [Candidatus Marsarchaeota archaeon]|nr:glycosyltransferase family 39 protein [Candidatus Marsarchaeota archaeon]
MALSSISRGRKNWLSHPIVPVVLVLAVSLAAHAFNMRNFPTFDQDEGTYVRDAWAVLRTGSLGAYVYIYGHAPVGWLQIAAWYVATGGFWTFGSPLDSARIFILLLHLGSTAILYGIAWRLSGRKEVAILACILFAVSPLAVAYQRRINLDNLMVFWLLASFYLLVNNRNRLSRVTLSALSLGIALLTKETAIFFLPAYLYLLWATTHKVQRRMGIPLWITVAASVVSTYILYAALQGELFPAGTLLGGSGKHVSLIETYLWQGSRTGNGSILDSGSLFWSIANGYWLSFDRVLSIGGAAASLIVIPAAFRNRLYPAVGLVPVCFFLYVARGGVVFDFYIIPAIPFLALAIALASGLALDGLGRLFSRFSFANSPVARPALIGVMVLGVGLYYMTQPLTTEIYSANRTAEQRRAVEWIAQNLPADTKIVIDGYAWAELHEGRPEWGGKKYPNAHFYWNLSKDPDTRKRTGIERWQDIQYLLISPIMVLDLERENLDPTLAAYRHSELVAKFDEVEIRKVLMQEAGQPEGVVAWGK